MNNKPELEARISEPLTHSPFYYRPFCLLSAVLALTVTAILLFGHIAAAVALSLWTCYAVFHFIRLKSLRSYLVWMLLIAVALGTAVGMVFTDRRTPIQKLAAENTEISKQAVIEPIYKTSKIKAEVITVYYSESFGCSYLVKLLSVDGEDAYGHAVLECPDLLNAIPYDILYCDGTFFTYEDGKGVSDTIYTRSNDIVARIETNTADVVYENNSKISRIAYELREKISFNLHRVCDNSSAASFAMAVVFGARDGMDQALERDCSALGVIHLLAVSGSHFSTLIAALAFILKRTYVPGHIRQLYFAAFAIAFTIMCGGTNAILRASIMAVFCMLIRFLGYEADSFIGLFFSLAALCIFRPYCVFDIGFLLSFFSTFGILLQLDRLMIPNKKEKSSIKLLNALWGAFKLTLFATLFSFPIIALAYENISFIGLIFNLIAIPIITVALFAAIILMITSGIPVVGPFCADVFQSLYEIIREGSNVIALNTDTAMSLRSSYVPYLLLIPLCLYILIRLLGINENLLSYIPLAVSIFCLVAANFIHIGVISGTAEVALVSLKNNEAVVLRSSNSAIICDFSDGTRSISEEAIKTVFDDMYCVDIDGYMLTHYHVRHISTIGNILRNYYLRTVVLPTPITADDKSIAKAIEQLTDRYGGEVTYYDTGEEFEIFDTKITALKAQHVTSTHPTVGVRLSYNGTSIAYLGSSYSTSTTAADMLALALNADTVILGAHGPKPKETEYFIYQHGRKIYASPLSAYEVRQGIDVKLKADENGLCKAFWKLEPSS